ncbi:MAG: rRNA maturation RNase YbeY, partial [Deltaproteobacteria bacterium]|nr:rRNA maturation RNase YbeY [Deltaproteobacteria bacterium]
REIQKIHGRFLKEPSVTDVITFKTPSPPVGEGWGEGTIDIVISLDQAAIQAKKRGLKLFHEAALLMCHGLLHVKGYNDLTEKEALLMRQKEFEWMMKVL